MGKPCEIEICGSFISDNEAEQFHRFIKERIAAYKAVSALWDDIDSSTEILCDHCGKPFSNGVVDLFARKHLSVGKLKSKGYADL